MTICVLDLLLYIVLYCNIGCYGFLATDAADSDANIRLSRVRYERRREKMFYFKIVKKMLFPNRLPLYAPKTRHLHAAEDKMHILFLTLVFHICQLFKNDVTFRHILY